MTDSTIPDKLWFSMQASTFWEQAATTLRFEYDDGDVTPLEPKHNFGWRTLPFLVLSQLTSNSGSIVFENGVKITAHAGDTLCIAPGMRHCSEDFFHAGNTSRWSHINLWVFDAVNLAMLFPLNGIVRGAAGIRIGDINEELATNHLPEHESGHWSFHVRRQALGLELAALLSENLARDYRDLARWQMMERLLPALAYIEAHLGESMNREELARQVHLSPSHFAALFKSALGMAPSSYARQQQLRRAQQLLLSTSLGVAEIARSCGFGNEFHFSRSFKAHLGLSPAHYRVKMRESQSGGF